ncbi:hypothetical protein YC2023_026118 [Brassica napus]
MRTDHVLMSVQDADQSPSLFYGKRQVDVKKTLSYAPDKLYRYQAGNVFFVEGLTGEKLFQISSYNIEKTNGHSE